MRLAVCIAALLFAGCSKKEERVPRKDDQAQGSGGVHGNAGASAQGKDQDRTAGNERVYVSDEDGGNVVVINTSNDSVIARIAVGKRPRGLRVSPDGARLFVALSGQPKAGPGVDESKLPPPDPSADGIGIVDLASLKLVRVIPGGKDPELFDVTSDGKRLWVSNEESAEASLIDIDAAKIIRHAPVGKEPEGVGIHPDGKVVYVTNEADNTVSVLDIESGAQVAKIATSGRPRAVLFTRDGLRAFITCENAGSVTVVDAKTHAATGELTLPGEGVRPMGLAIAPDGHTLYVSGGRSKTVHVVDLNGAAPSIKSTITDVGARPWGIGITRSGEKVYTANGSAGDVSVIDAATGSVTNRIPVGGSPWGIAVH